MGVRGGAEAVVHATRATLNDTSIPPEQKWSLHGFNLVDRGAMFGEVREHFPELARYIENSYGQASVLNYGSGSLLSSTGVHQGDPLGPFLFSLTLQPVLKKVQEVEGIVQNSWYLDDGEVVGNKQALGGSV